MLATSKQTFVCIKLVCLMLFIDNERYQEIRLDKNSKFKLKINLHTTIKLKCTCKRNYYMAACSWQQTIPAEQSQTPVLQTFFLRS